MSSISVQRRRSCSSDDDLDFPADCFQKSTHNRVLYHKHLGKVPEQPYLQSTFTPQQTIPVYSILNLNIRTGKVKQEEILQENEKKIFHLSQQTTSGSITQLETSKIKEQHQSSQSNSDDNITQARQLSPSRLYQPEPHQSIQQYIEVDMTAHQIPLPSPPDPTSLSHHENNTIYEQYWEDKSLIQQGEQGGFNITPPELAPISPHYSSEQRQLSTTQHISFQPEESPETTTQSQSNEPSKMGVTHDTASTKLLSPSLISSDWRKSSSLSLRKFYRSPFFTIFSSFITVSNAVLLSYHHPTNSYSLLRINLDFTQIILLRTFYALLAFLFFLETMILLVALRRRLGTPRTNQLAPSNVSFPPYFPNSAKQQASPDAPSKLKEKCSPIRSYTPFFQSPTAVLAFYQA